MATPPYAALNVGRSTSVRTVGQPGGRGVRVEQPTKGTASSDAGRVGAAPYGRRTVGGAAGDRTPPAAAGRRALQPSQRTGGVVSQSCQSKDPLHQRTGRSARLPAATPADAQLAYVPDSQDRLVVESAGHSVRDASGQYEVGTDDMPRPTNFRSSPIARSSRRHVRTFNMHFSDERLGDEQGEADLADYHDQAGSPSFSQDYMVAASLGDCDPPFSSRSARSERSDIELPSHRAMWVLPPEDPSNFLAPTTPSSRSSCSIIARGGSDILGGSQGSVASGSPNGSVNLMSSIPGIRMSNVTSIPSDGCSSVSGFGFRNVESETSMGRWRGGVISNIPEHSDGDSDNPSLAEHRIDLAMNDGDLRRSAASLSQKERAVSFSLMPTTGSGASASPACTTPELQTTQSGNPMRQFSGKQHAAFSDEDRRGRRAAAASKSSVADSEVCVQTPRGTSKDVFLAARGRLSTNEGMDVLLEKLADLTAKMASTVEEESAGYSHGNTPVSTPVHRVGLGRQRPLPWPLDDVSAQAPPEAPQASPAFSSSIPALNVSPQKKRVVEEENEGETEADTLDEDSHDVFGDDLLNLDAQHLAPEQVLSTFLALVRSAQRLEASAKDDDHPHRSSCSSRDSSGWISPPPSPTSRLQTRELAVKLEAREKELKQLQEAMESILNQNQKLARRGMEVEAAMARMQGATEEATARAHRAGMACAEAQAEVLHQRAMAEYSRQALLIHEHLDEMERKRKARSGVNIDAVPTTGASVVASHGAPLMTTLPAAIARPHAVTPPTMPPVVVLAPPAANIARHTWSTRANTLQKPSGWFQPEQTTQGGLRQGGLSWSPPVPAAALRRRSISPPVVATPTRTPPYSARRPDLSPGRSAVQPADGSQMVPESQHLPVGCSSYTPGIGGRVPHGQLFSARNRRPHPLAEVKVEPVAVARPSISPNRTCSPPRWKGDVPCTSLAGGGSRYSWNGRISPPGSVKDVSHRTEGLANVRIAATPPPTWAGWTEASTGSHSGLTTYSPPRPGDEGVSSSVVVLTPRLPVGSETALGYTSWTPTVARIVPPATHSRTPR
eukprot:TRINITY_DN37975_c0_g1_i1.p1 TRINITY_DN37975_c0_g1~~TRINITY_DN37975_c0_g1_i1.p1  ORF type:complete len:1068 (-),score=93.68 TRINITY_DN37975_c0_g1_i1:248-3451(-)